MKKLLLTALAAFGILSAPARAAQDQVLAFVVATCGTLATPYIAGKYGILTMDVNGKLCDSATGGGGGGGAVFGPTAVGSAAANPPVQIGGTVDGTATGSIQTWKVVSGIGYFNLAQVGGSTFTLGQQLAAASLPVVLTAAQLITLTPPAAITGFATKANQDTNSATTTHTCAIAGFSILGCLGQLDDDIKGAIAAGANVIGGVFGSPNVTQTDCSITLTTGGTAQNIIAAGATLHGFRIMNIDASAGSGEPVWMSFTTTAAAAIIASYPLAAPTATTFAGAGSYSAEFASGTNGNVSVIAATTGHKISCTKW